ncbi:uncharacterized protein UDID_17759 [Ustilago sp. UG-2017a]|nr:uncharacterized protein UDID_17759 [Ustilago sp. UG-2017a]
MPMPIAMIGPDASRYAAQASTTCYGSENTPTLPQKLRPNRTLGIHRLFEAFSSTFGSSAGSTSQQTASDQPPPKKAEKTIA